ncbi:MAG TPA: glycosyltransferase, partial [Anaerolineales bacterium]|nr:glycosyltransferase [Anaerolineales bacterium]
MRIAYLTQSYPPMISGAAIVVEGLARAMANRGHQVLVIAASERGPAYCTAEEKLTVLRMESLHNPLRVGQRFLLYPRCSMMKTLREFDPEMIHAHEPLQLGLLGSEYAGEAKIPIILTVHQTPSFVASYLPNILRACVTNVLWIYARWFSRKVTSMITPTQTISELFTQMTGVSANTISSGINLEIFHPTLSGDEEAATRQKWNLPSSVPILLHVGRLDVEKRVERVIQAAAGALHQTDAHL